MIGHVNSANPKECERFYLRLLLNHVKSPTSFEDLLIVDGIHYLSFKETVEKKSLLESMIESLRFCIVQEDQDYPFFHLAYSYFYTPYSKFYQFTCITFP